MGVNVRHISCRVWEGFKTNFKSPFLFLPLFMKYT